MRWNSRPATLNQLRNLRLALLQVLRVERAVREDQVVQGAIVDDRVDKLHVVGDLSRLITLR